ncbi:hypothetical protein LRS06_04670 [Hymenobacter sp. J193]|uniref:hypothetical protein n=1 Tax=Hymenobacter sp. J193 TaxID=2898429 RepID=UPI002150DE1B|nr:hypothetical protein [Hymenobacter sp. J193]MCR5887080.1 hypothetical protein [Hymenobacter sp. J193]
MEYPLNTDKITFELDEYLRVNNCFDNCNTADVNKQIVSSWGRQFEEAISRDVASRFKYIKISVIYSEFDISSEDNRGACVFQHKAELVDSENMEFVKVSIRTLVNYHKTVIYLDSAYATIDKWSGKSKSLMQIFDKLKMAHQQTGYFKPITLKAMLNN